VPVSASRGADTEMNLGRTLVALLILGGLFGSLITGSAFYSHILYLGLILLIGAWIWVHVVTRSLYLTRQADFARASVGDIFKEQFEVVNKSRLPGLWVEMYNEMPLPTAAGSRLLTRLKPREKQSYIARTWLTRRGGFPIGPTVLTVSDPLGLFRIQKSFPAEKSLVILPMIFPIATFLSPPGLLPGGQVIRRKTMDVTPHASGVREYIPGDPMKRIHWPTSARRGQLMVKEFEQDPQAEVWLFLDAQQKVQAQKSFETPDIPLENLLFSRKPKLTLPPSTLEYEISIAASLAHYFIEQKRAVGLVTQDRGYNMIPAERSERQENKILETLAFLEGKGDLSIAALVSAQARQLPQGSSAILITPTVSLDLLLAADDLQRRNLRPVVVLLVAETFTGSKGSDKIARQLTEQRVPVCLVYCDADLSQTLSAFSSSHFSQDATTWQRPALSHLT
ncbi:MAG TPA: DUF58 domain-containing protein, partial [Anaerolineales bacterium]|nr:DUF58 domain-containing protein [Anaerolineales bacterium]